MLQYLIKNKKTRTDRNTCCIWMYDFTGYIINNPNLIADSIAYSISRKAKAMNNFSCVKPINPFAYSPFARHPGYHTQCAAQGGRRRRWRDPWEHRLSTGWWYAAQAARPVQCLRGARESDTHGHTAAHEHLPQVGGAPWNMCPVCVGGIMRCSIVLQAGNRSHAACHQACPLVSLWSEAGHRWHHRNESCP